ncbi:MAG: glycosyltransferase family 25 protein [Pseudomonadota bacterium]|nr:glycosyltransferase family 25 protein [Pseudomonadota bacterium]
MRLNAFIANGQGPQLVKKCFGGADVAGDLAIFVINLDRSADRRRMMQARLATAGLVAQFFPAVDGRVLRRDSMDDLEKASGLSDGEVGCYLSHLSVWRAISESRVARALVLEDDVRLDPALNAILADLASPPCNEIDLIRLSCSQKAVGKTLMKLSSHRSLLLPTKNPSSAMAYVVTMRGAKRLLNALSRPFIPIDTAIDRCWQQGIRSALVAPPVVCHDDDFQSIITPTGRSNVSSSRRLPTRLARSLKKHATLASDFAALTGAGWLSYWLTETVSVPSRSGF